MDKILVKLKKAVALRGKSSSNGPAIRDVRTDTITFSSYRWVLAAVLLVALYYVFWASDRYSTVSLLYVKSSETGAAMSPVQFFGGNQGEGRDGALLMVYTQSRDMLFTIEKAIRFNEHFSSGDADLFSRMPENPSAEERLKFFKKHLTVSMNPDSGIISIRTQAFTPEFSLKFIEAVIKASEAFINGIGHDIAKKEILFVEKEMDRAREKLNDSRMKLLQFQNANGILSAEAAGASLQELVSHMEADLVRLKTDEKLLAGYLNEGAAELVTARARVGVLEKQLVIEKAKLASTEGRSFNDVGAEYQALEMEMTFATDVYKTALVALERARVESYHKLKHLVVVQSPTLPDEALYPRKLYNLLTLFIGLSLAYGIVTMILATIREHRDV
ncbi:MAG: hypothetical protein JKY34_12080 [Kordiimonadaceae bacterium]|nr:hypothetical protein [Kordiimonadaceae bacterium]